MITTSTEKVFLLFRVLLLQSPHVTKINDHTSSLEVLAAKEFNKMFSGRQQR